MMGGGKHGFALNSPWIFPQSIYDWFNMPFEMNGLIIRVIGSNSFSGSKTRSIA
jgi:hypothetical protein